MTVAAFAQAVRAEDSATLTRIPGVGRKIAERLIVEMRDRLEGDSILVSNVPPGSGAERLEPGAQAEAYSALVALGYKPGEATALLKGLGGMPVPCPPKS